MKKIIAGILAFTTVFTMLTGCGKKESSKESSSVSSSETFAQPNHSENIEDAIKDYLAAYKNEDLNKIAYFSYPTEFVDTGIECDSHFLEPLSIDNQIGKNVIYKSILKKEKMSDDDIAQIKKQLIECEAMLNIMKKYGNDLSDITEEDKKAAFNAKDTKYNITEAYDVEVNIECELEDSVINHWDVQMYYIENDGWKVGIEQRS